MLNEGDKAPGFSTHDSQGRRVKLADFRGRKVVLYFYPRDNTPGCTKEACSFRDDFPQFQKLGIQVLGVSPDSEASHLKFISKYDLPFTLLTDPDHALAEAYGTYGEKTFMGKKFLGVHRTTFINCEDGRIAKIFSKVKAEGHAKEVLAAARS